MQFPTNTTTSILAMAAVLCTAGFAMSQSLEQSAMTGKAARAIDGTSCGGAEITQNTDPNVLVAGSVACAAAGSTTDNFYARNFAIGAATSIKCVDFGVEQNNIASPTTVRVRLYTHPTAGTPVTANMTLIPGSEMTVAVPASATLQFLNATYPGTGISVPAGNLVVELFTPCRQTTCTPPGDGGGTWLGSNAAGQSAPCYLKAPACGLADYSSLASIGFPNIHMVINLGTNSSGGECATALPPCRADVTGPGNTPPDGTVNVNDLLAVINTWGQNGNPNGPRPKGDCQPLPNGDCFVNVNDLLQVINTWGPCKGRCCLPNGTCIPNITSPDCGAAGGTYGGHDSTCGPPNPCPVLPPNDECGGAIAVTNGPTNISNVGATTSAGIPGAACIFGGAANFQRDVWFTYTATCTGMVIVDLCATTGAVTDTTLSVLTGPCDSLNEVACDDDSCTGNPAGDRSRTSFLASAGTQYLIRVGTWGGNAPGPMVLTISCGATPPHGIVAIKQLHWDGGLNEGILIPYSRVGVAEWTFDVTNPIHRQLLLANGGGYVNLMLASPNGADGGGDGDNWVVRNLYLAYPNDNYLIEARPTVQFALPVSQGQPLINAFCAMSITPQPLNNPQPQFQFSAILTHPVYHTGGRNDGGSDLSILPFIIGPWTGPLLLPVDWAFISIPTDQVAEIDENTNFCAPASCARSLDYLGAPGDPQDMCDDLADLMETSKKTGTTDENMEAGKEAYTKGHNLNITTTREYGANRFDKAMAALAAGCDVEGLISWTGGGGHAAMITGIVKWPDGSYTITYVDDPTQGDDTAENEEHTIHVQPNGDFAGGNMDGIMIECPN